MFTQAEIQEALIWSIKIFINATNIVLILVFFKFLYLTYNWRQDRLREEQKNRELCCQRLFEYLENSKSFFELVKEGHPTVILLNTFYPKLPNLLEQYKNYDVLCHEYVRLFLTAKTFLLLVSDGDLECVEKKISDLEYQSKLISKQVSIFESIYETCLEENEHF